MRISDWSSDVCSSDLLDIAALRARQAEPACRDLKPIGIGCGGGESRDVETVDGSGANIHARIAARGGRRRGLGCRDSNGAERCRPAEAGGNSEFNGFFQGRKEGGGGKRG